MRKLLSLALLPMFVACSATQLKEGAEKVIVFRGSAVPKSCQFVASIVGQQGDAFTGGFTSNKKLAQGALNDLRNEALQLGANLVSVVNSTAGSDGFEQTDVTYTGTAYRCPAAEIGIQ